MRVRGEGVVEAETPLDHLKVAEGAVEAPAWLDATFDAFRVPTYRLLWANSAFMLLAVNLAFTLQNVVAFDITGKNSAVGLVAFAQGWAMLLSTPVAGVIADGMSKRLLLALSELALGLMALCVSALIFTGLINIGFLIAGGFIFGSSVSFFWPAQTALMGDVVEPERRANGAALFQVCLNFTRSLAPFIGSALLAVSVIGSGGGYLVVALLFLPVLATAAALPRTVIRGAAANRMWSDVKLGIQHVREVRPLLEAMVAFILITLLGFSIMVVLPGFTKDVLHAGDSGFGIMFGVNAIGALIASLGVASMAQSSRLPLLLTASGVAFGLSLSLTGLMPTFALAVLAMGLVGMAGAAFQTLIMAQMLRVAEPQYFGRVMSLTNAAWALMSLLGLVVGALADLTSERAVLVGVGLSVTLASLGLAFWTRGRALPPALLVEA